MGNSDMRSPSYKKICKATCSSPKREWSNNKGIIVIVIELIGEVLVRTARLVCIYRPSAWNPLINRPPRDLHIQLKHWIVLWLDKGAGGRMELSIYLKRLFYKSRMPKIRIIFDFPISQLLFYNAIGYFDKLWVWRVRAAPLMSAITYLRRRISRALTGYSSDIYKLWTSL